MNITCPNCGATSSLDNGNATCECLYCGTKLSANSHNSRQSASKDSKNMKISSYVELAETAFRGKDYKGLKKYADLALEQNVSDSKLWWYKTLAEAKGVINERNRTSWIFECGEKSILYAKDKKKAAADISLVYIELANDKLNFMSQWPKPDFYEDPDSDVLDYENDVITLIRKVPKDAIEQYPDVKKKMLIFSQSWLRHMNQFTGTSQRARYLRQIYNEIAPISDSEKKRELKLLANEI